MRKIVFAGVGVAALGLLVLTPTAFADGNDYGFGQGSDGSSDHVYTHKVQECNHHELEGVFQIPRDEDSSNNDSHDGDCEQHNYPNDDD